MRVRSDSISGLCLAGRHAYPGCGMKALVILAFVAAPAFGQLGPLIYSQNPNRLFGYSADTEFVDDFGQTIGQLVADRFVLSQPRRIGQIRWFGIYGSQFGPIQSPPAQEEFRIRFYDQQGTFPPNLPPASVLYETTFSNPLREETGLLVSGGFPEYRYTVELQTPFDAMGNTLYWLEITQLGIPSSRFRWENSSGGEYAVQFPVGSAWQTFSASQMAFELRVPEPFTGSLLALAALAGAMSRSNR